MSTIERPTSAPANELETFTRLSDSDWEKATSKVEKAVDRYAHVDFGRLAEGVADEYVKARAEVKAAELLATGIAFSVTAQSTTRGMVAALVGGHTDQGRMRAAGISGVWFLAPLTLLLAIVYFWHAKFGWYGVPRVTLLVGLAGFTVLSVLLIASFVRDGAVVRVLPKQASLALSIGAVAATVVSTLAIRELRSSESDTLALASRDMSSFVMDAVASADSPISRVAFMAESQSQDRYDVLAKSLTSQRAVSIHARGLPGHLTATLESPDSVRVTWSRPLKPEVTKTLIKQGKVEFKPGGALFITRDGNFPVSETLAKAIPPDEKAVAEIDAETKTVMRLVPLASSRVTPPVLTAPAAVR